MSASPQVDFGTPAVTIANADRRENLPDAAALERDYQAIRAGIGISDASDMAKFSIRGSGATALLQELATGNVERMVEGTIRWTVILGEDGRVMADIQIYKEFSEYFLTCDGDARPTVLRLLQDLAAADVQIEDQSDQLAAIAIEGPEALPVPAMLLGPEAGGLSFLRFIRGSVAATDVLFGRIGFAAEFGYLIFAPSEAAGSVMAAVMEAAPSAVVCNRAVQSVLRLEVRAFNRRHDLFKDETALQAGLHWMIDFRKLSFRGREAVMGEKHAGLSLRLVGFMLDQPTSDGIARGAQVEVKGQPVGYVANAAYSYQLGRMIGLCYLDDAYAWVGVPIKIAGAASGANARIVSAPFFLTESTIRASG